MKTLVVTGVIALMASRAFAQTPDSLPPSDRAAAVEANLATPTGHEFSAGLASYTYREPGEHNISIHGARFVGDYTGTVSLNQRRRWFAQAQARATLGNVAYNGWCSPLLITPAVRRQMVMNSMWAMRHRAARPATRTGIWKPAV